MGTIKLNELYIFEIYLNVRFFSSMYYYQILVF